MARRLKEFSVGEHGRVVGFDKGSRAYRKKLLSLGVTPGAEFRVVRYAPLGDPMEIRVRGSSLVLRKGETEALLVEGAGR